MKGELLLWETDKGRDRYEVFRVGSGRANELPTDEVQFSNCISRQEVLFLVEDRPTITISSEKQSRRNAYRVCSRRSKVDETPISECWETRSVGEKLFYWVVDLPTRL